eukprot:gene4390-3192_t
MLSVYTPPKLAKKLVAILLEVAQWWMDAKNRTENNNNTTNKQKINKPLMHGDRVASPLSPLEQPFFSSFVSFVPHSPSFTRYVVLLLSGNHQLSRMSVIELGTWGVRAGYIGDVVPTRLLRSAHCPQAAEETHIMSMLRRMSHEGAAECELIPMWCPRTLESHREAHVESLLHLHRHLLQCYDEDPLMLVAPEAWHERSDMVDSLCQMVLEGGIAPSLYCCRPSVAWTLGQGRSSALVTDIGYSHVTIAAVLDGQVLRHTVESAPVGSAAVLAQFQASLRPTLQMALPAAFPHLRAEARGQLEVEVASDLMEKVSFVASHEMPVTRPPPVAGYRAPDGTPISLTPAQRCQPYEVLFRCEEGGFHLAELVTRSKNRLDPEWQASCVHHLVAGGCSAAPGLLPRLAEELGDKDAAYGRYEQHAARPHGAWVGAMGGRGAWIAASEVISLGWPFAPPFLLPLQLRPCYSGGVMQSRRRRALFAEVQKLRVSLSAAHGETTEQRNAYKSIYCFFFPCVNVEKDVTYAKAQMHRPRLTSPASPPSPSLHHSNQTPSRSMRGLLRHRVPLRCRAPTRSAAAKLQRRRDAHMTSLLDSLPAFQTIVLQGAAPLADAAPRSSIRQPTLPLHLPEGWIRTTSGTLKELLGGIVPSGTVEHDDVFLAAFIHPTFHRRTSNPDTAHRRQRREAAMPLDTLRAGGAALRVLQALSTAHAAQQPEPLRDSILERPPLAPPLTQERLLHVAVACGVPNCNPVAAAVPQEVVAAAFTSLCGAISLSAGTEAVARLLDRHIPPQKEEVLCHDDSASIEKEQIYSPPPPDTGCYSACALPSVRLDRVWRYAVCMDLLSPFFFVPPSRIFFFCVSGRFLSFRQEVLVVLTTWRLWRCAFGASCDGGGDDGGGRTMQDVVRAIDVLANARHPRLNHMENTKWLMEYLGFAPAISSLRLIHVAGTKGKGSTSWYMSNFLQSYGLRVGLFTSPHLTDPRERILVNNEKLPEPEFTSYFFSVLDRLEALRGSEDEEVAQHAQSVGFFSLLFLVCAHIFEQEKVEVAVIETGIGGRCDTTNIVQPAVTVITALGFDHMSILGDTIELIAFQKAGIIKPGTVCFSFTQRDYPQTRAILEAEAAQCHAPISFYEEATFAVPSVWPPLAIGGAHMVENSKVALLAARHLAGRSAAAPLSTEEETVLRRSTLAGRSQVLALPHCTLYLDGAHTPESLSYATKWFIEESDRRSGGGKPPARTLLFYTSRSAESVLRSFAPYAERFQRVVIAQIYNPKPTADSPSADDVDGWRRYANQQAEATCAAWRKLYPTLPCECMAKRLEHFEDVDAYFVSGAHVFICGSFFLLADVLRCTEERKPLNTDERRTKSQMNSVDGATNLSFQQIRMSSARAATTTGVRQDEAALHVYFRCHAKLPVPGGLTLENIFEDPVEPHVLAFICVFIGWRLPGDLGPPPGLTESTCRMRALSGKLGLPPTDDDDDDDMEMMARN